VFTSDGGDYSNIGSDHAGIGLHLSLAVNANLNHGVVLVRPDVENPMRHKVPCVMLNIGGALSAKCGDHGACRGRLTERADYGDDAGLPNERPPVEGCYAPEQRPGVIVPTAQELLPSDGRTQECRNVTPSIRHRFLSIVEIKG